MPAAVPDDDALGSDPRLITEEGRREVSILQECERRAKLLRRVVPSLPQDKVERLDRSRVNLRISPMVMDLCA